MPAHDSLGHTAELVLTDATATYTDFTDGPSSDRAGDIVVGRLDGDSQRWIRELTATGARRDEALARLHGLLLRIAGRELRRRSGQHSITGPELDDIAHQATADALVAITGKLDRFRGESRFTTWAYRFVVIEVSTKLGRHFWRHPTVTLATADWNRLPDRFGMGPAEHAQWQELVAALRQAVEQGPGHIAYLRRIGP